MIIDAQAIANATEQGIKAYWQGIFFPENDEEFQTYLASFGMQLSEEDEKELVEAWDEGNCLYDK